MPDLEFTIKCKMKDRWVPHFLGLLKEMEHLGNIGASREVSIYADGDGDFQPKFNIPDDLPEPAKPDSVGPGGKINYDAG